MTHWRFKSPLVVSRLLGHRPTLRVIVFLIAATIVVASGIVTAYAHAQLLSADPPVGSLLALPPREVTLKFSEKLEPAFSSIVVRDAMGARVDKDDAHVDKYMASMRISVQPLTSGPYIVEWRALSVSTHKTEGAFVFRVSE